MESHICYFVFLLQTATPCHIPQLVSYLHQPPKITSPKENGIVSRKEISLAWTPASPKLDLNGLLTFLYDLSYKLEIRKRGEGINSTKEYKTKNQFIILPGKIFLAGYYQTRIASIGVFGWGEWSKVRKFEIVDAKTFDESGGDPKLSTVSSTSKTGNSTVPSKKPEKHKKPVFVP